jgi:hypothetical protein
MRELSVIEIAAAVAGYPCEPLAELRLLILFQTNAVDSTNEQSRASRTLVR